MTGGSETGLVRVPHPAGLSISESVSSAGPGRWIHVSGQIPLGPGGEIVTGPMREQARLVFDALQAALVRAEADLTDVVKITVFLTDFADLGEVNAERSERFGDQLPASSAVQVQALFGGAQLEIEAIAFTARAG